MRYDADRAVRRSFVVTIVIMTLSVGALVLPLSRACAQRSAPDSAQLMQTITRGMRMLTPAKSVLERRVELQLSSDQIVALTKLVAAEQDSATARQQRVIAALGQQATGPGGAVDLMAWDGPVDEAKMRAEACRNSAAQVESTIGMARDRHAVGAVLTPAQRATMQSLEMKSMIKGYSKP